MASRYRSLKDALGGWRAAAAVAGVLGVLALGTGAVAQDEPPPAEREPAEEARAPAPEDAPPRPARGDDDVFIPTEEIAADEEVVFPVDI